MLCKICNNSFKRVNELAVHVKNKHAGEISVNEYYIKYVSDKELCPICHEEKKFKNISSGYYKTCGKKECVNKLREKTNIEKNGVAYNLQRKDIRKKIEKIFEAKFNGKSPFCDKEVNLKKEKTLLSRYNVNNCRKIPEVIEQIKIKNKTNQKNLTEDNKREIKLKRKNTVFNNFGTDNPMKNDLIKKEHSLSMFKNHQVEHYNQLKEVKDLLSQKWKEDNPMKDPKIISKIIENKNLKNFNRILTGQRTNYLVAPLFTEVDYKGMNHLYKWKCLRCENEFFDHLNNGKIPRCLRCYPTITYCSNIEKEIQLFIESYIPISRNKKFYCQEKEKNYELDIYIPEKNVGIELDGLYWHSEIAGNKDKNYHLDKTNFFKKRRIQIFHIWDIEWTEKNNIVKSLLLSKIGIYTTKIRASKLQMKLINCEEERKFLENNHLQGYTPSKICLGLVDSTNEVKCILTLGKPRFNRNYKWELLRFCTKINTTVYGGFSKLLQYFEKTFSPVSIITYADLRTSTGNVYLKNNFMFLNQSSPNYYYTLKYKILESRLKYQKHKLKNLFLNFNPSLTEWENMQLNGYDRVWDCGTLSFIKKYF